VSKLILPVIVISQFCCTSLWFAGNGVMSDLILNFNLQESALAHLTASVQFGFISGTLVFAILTIADRFSPSKVFLISALLGAVFNLAVIWEGNNITSILVLRFLTGFFLAGIYPIGMKIAADHFDKGLGKSLGFLVGALVLGTALPHLLKDVTNDYPWQYVLILTSSLAVLGGSLIALTIRYKTIKKSNSKPEFTAFFKVFKNQQFRSAAFGYFGHMWELYTFWAFVPVILKTYNITHSSTNLNIPFWSFIIIGSGGLACVVSGYIAQKKGAKNTATASLILSGLCCLLSPFLFQTNSEGLFIAFLIFWGMVVIADSPMLSTLVAQNATPEIKGTALTIVNCIGFSITIVSIQLISMVSEVTNSNNIYALLCIGPILALLALRKKKTDVI